jgi:hypothetical protein
MFGSTKPLPPPAGYQRHSLGLPAGSIRALLALGVLGMLWLLAGRYNEQHKLPLEFIYLQFLMLLMLASYFTAHGKTIGREVSVRSPLGLPAGVVRLLLVAGYLGLAVFMWYRGAYQFDKPLEEPPLLLILLLLGCFFLGYLATRLVHWVSGPTLPYIYQDIQAWVAILALMGMGILALWHLVSPTLDESNRQTLEPLEAILAAVVGFYFGARS